MTTWTKLKDGSWGLRSTSPLPEGASITVSKKDGSSSPATVGRKVWEGNGVYLYTTSGGSTTAKKVSSGHHSYKSRRPWRPCGYPGCNPSYCDECDGHGG